MRYIGIIILLVLCLTLLASADSIISTVNAEPPSGDLGIQVNIEKSVKWSGLGMGLYSSQENYIDTLLTNGFTELRIDIPDYQNTSWLAGSKAALPGIIAKGVKVIWGVSCGAEKTITAANWPAFRLASLDAAQWAQNNGVYEFQLGNELEGKNDDTTLTDVQLIANLKSLATEVQAIFTRGNVSYSCFHSNIDDWVSAGKGDIDLLASNVYREWGVRNTPHSWEDAIDALVSGFGADGTYLTEFNLNSTGIEYYSKDESVQATALTEMIDYIKASGMTRAFFYCWKDDGKYRFGIVKADGSYRLLWNQALLNTGR
jgi:hypothetical protein